MATLGEVHLDRDPGGGEWTVRQTLGHIVSSQRGYGWYNAWWLDRGHAPGPLPARAGVEPGRPFDADWDGGDKRLPELPDEAAEAGGTPAEIMLRFDGLVDQGAERFATIDAEALTIPARWSGLRVDLAFRIGRLGSHIREHTIQLDKTVAMLGRPTTEVERLIRLTGASYGRLEVLVFARSAETLAAPFPDGASATALLEACAVDVRDLGASIARAAERAGA